MKRFFSIFLFVSASLSMSAQSEFYGALKIKSELIIISGDSFTFNPDYASVLAACLKAYLPKKDITNEELTEGQVFAKYRNNPFFGKQIEVLINAGASADKSGLVKQSLSSLGGLDVTNIADGLAKFLVERVKQELSTSFFERFKRELDNLKQLQIIFPTTYKALNAIDKEIYNYASYLDLLRESFQKDLTFLLPNIERLIDDPCMDFLFSKFPEIRVMMSDGLYMVNAIAAGQFPGEAFHNYRGFKADSTRLSSIHPYLYPSLVSLDLFSQSFRSQQSGKYWVDRDSLNLIFDNITFRLYMGLIYQQAKNQRVNFPGNKTLAGELASLAGKIDELKALYQPFLTGLIERGKTIEYSFNVIKEIQGDGNVNPTYQDYFSLFDASLNFTEFIIQSPFVKDNINPGLDLPQNLSDYFASARSLGNIYVDVYEKQYTSAIAEFSGLLQILMKEKLANTITDLDRSIDDEPDESTRSKLRETRQEFTKMQIFMEDVMKYGTFAASIAKAETSDDVKNAIEAAALPAGSSRIKRETPFNVSLNAYTGLFVGYEKIVEFDDEFALNSYGLTAPVGVAISHGCNHWSYSAFVSLIDLGTVAAFRFTTDSDTAGAQVPTIQLQDIFSPGVFFSVGIPKCPLSINLGAQVGPNLRKIYAEEDETGELIYQNQYEENVYWRFSISLLVDIPIFNLYTKSR